MIRMRKTSWRRTDWMFCLASFLMTASISFQPAPREVAAAPAAAAKAEVKIDAETMGNFSDESQPNQGGPDGSWSDLFG